MKKISAVNIALISAFAVSAAVIFIKPTLYIGKVIIKGALYSALVYGINLITSLAGITAGINIVSSFLYGTLGIYGVILSYFAGFLYSFKL